MLNFPKMPRRIATNQIEQELGFGKTLTDSGRMMNPNGVFNVERERFGYWDNTYFHLMMMPGWQFFVLALSGFILLNFAFSIIYCLIGIEHLHGTTPGNLMHQLTQAYFFSSQTLTTVGYGHISPDGLPANVIASFESFLGLLTFALISGLLYGRFSRPVARIAFSEKILVAPYRSGQGLMFRMVNAARSELIETEVQVILTVNQREENGNISRRFFALPLEIAKVSFFSLSWTIVHEINEKSPIYGFSHQDLIDAMAEFLILVKGTDEANQQMVHVRHSYTGEEMAWNARFLPVIGRNKKGKARVLTSLVGEYEIIE
jgi:inward rectifier potassium channel